MGKAHDQEKTPDREQRTDILRMLKAGERKLSRPGNPITEFVAVEHADLAQAMENDDVERLPGGDHRRAEPKRPRAAIDRQPRPYW